MRVHAEAGDLHMCVGLLGDAREAVAPLVHDQRVLVVRQHARVQEDELHIRECLNELGGVVRLRGEHLQLEMEAVLLDQLEALAEGRRVAQVWPVVDLPQRVRFPVELVAHALHGGKFRQPRKQFRRRIGGQIDLCRKGMRIAVLLGDRMQPARLIERLRHAPVGRHVHGLHDALRLHVVHPLLDREVAT